jgi:sensor c-di-GMP phosphodiesterase-like protein
MGKRTLTIITALVVMVGIAVPIVLSIYLARHEAIDSEKSRARAYALDVIARSEAVTDQINDGIDKLVAARTSDPCSLSNQALMKQIDLSSSYIQAIGYVFGNRMVCSSLGSEITGLELGPVDMVRKSGAKFRINVEFPFAKGSKFLVVERDGYAAIIHKDLPIDVTTNVEGISLATLSYPELNILTSRGVIKKEWLQLFASGDTTFVDHDYVVAVARPKRHMIAAISAVPVAELNKKIYSISLVLVPFGLLASVLFAWAVFYLAKLRTAMPAVIKSALKRKEFFLEYQPLVELSTGRWIGVEALIRWRRMDGEIVRPDIFIPIAEDSGLIRQISQYVVCHIASEAAELLRRRPDFHIGINLAADDLHEEETVFMLRELAASMGARNRNFIIEATERSFTDHKVAISVISKLRSEGFPVAIDDFGTGYSSLAYLERIQLDYLKIDKSFVETLDTDSATSEVILHIIEMAKSLKLEMIAEGVETEAQAQFLRERGVRYAQGWLFGKPMSLSAIIAGLENPNNAMAAQQ